MRDAGLKALGPVGVVPSMRAVTVARIFHGKSSGFILFYTGHNINIGRNDRIGEDFIFFSDSQPKFRYSIIR